MNEAWTDATCNKIMAFNLRSCIHGRSSLMHVQPASRNEACLKLTKIYLRQRTKFDAFRLDEFNEYLGYGSMSSWNMSILYYLATSPTKNLLREGVKAISMRTAVRSDVGIDILLVEL